MIKFSIQDLQKAEAEFQKDEAYAPESLLIADAIKSFPNHPKTGCLNSTDEFTFNKCGCADQRTIVAMKIALIDLTNTTQLSSHKSKISLAQLTDLIISIPDLDSRLKRGDITLVSEIASETKRQYGVNLFSFASKYCFYHNFFAYGKCDFSIFDSIVSTHLWEYSPTKMSRTCEKWRVNIDYQSYWDKIGEILDANGISETKYPNRRYLFDHYVWYLNR